MTNAGFSQSFYYFVWVSAPMIYVNGNRVRPFILSHTKLNMCLKALYL